MSKRILYSQLATFAVPFLLATSLTAGNVDKRLDIYWIDVEGGAATLVATPAGESILIDTGLPRQRYVDRIRDVIIDVAGFNRLDHLIISHYDVDHYGGATGLSRELPIVNLYDNGKFQGMRRDPGENYWMIRCRQRNVLNPGDELPLRQATEPSPMPVTLRCIATRQQFIGPPDGAAQNDSECGHIPQKDDDASENANSMVLTLEFGRFRFFNATDLTWNLESRLVCPVNLIGQADVYQVTHHGLDRSNNPLVIRSLAPTISVMNNGPTKGCDPEVFANLQSAPSIKAMYQMHKNQRPDGNTNNTVNEFIANKGGESGNYIKISVAPDAKSYTASIPATGHMRTFQTN